jgi:hypothetical protein
MKVHLLSLIWLSLPLAGRLNAAVPLFDFEQPADVVTWKWHSKGQSKLVRTNRFATTDTWSLVFATPGWKQAMPGWPSFETRPAASNWTAFDRLGELIDRSGAAATNPWGNDFGVRGLAGQRR